MKRELWLQQKTVEELFSLYRDEHSRINQKDRQITQTAIKHELLCRVEDMFCVLDLDEPVNVHGAYLQNFWQPALKSRDDPAWRW